MANKLQESKLQKCVVIAQHRWLVCVLRRYYNKHEKDQLLPMCLMERKRMKKWYMKLFRRLLSAMVFNSLIMYRHNTGHNFDCLKFCIDLVEGLLVNYSVQHKVSSHHDDNTVKRQTECHFPRIILSTERHVNNKTVQ